MQRDQLKHEIIKISKKSQVIVNILETLLTSALDGVGAVRNSFQHIDAQVDGRSEDDA